MDPVIKTESYNCDDYEWISEASDDLVKYDVVEETVAEWSDQPQSTSSSVVVASGRELETSSLAGNSLCDSAFSSYFEPGKVDLSVEEEKPSLGQIPDPIKTPWNIKYKCPCCFSALEKFRGPLKKRILMAVRSLTRKSEDDVEIVFTSNLDTLNHSMNSPLPSSFVSPSPSPSPPMAPTSRGRRAARNSAAADVEEFDPAAERSSEISEFSGENYEGGLELVPSPTSMWKKIVMKVNPNSEKEREIQYQMMSSRGGDRVNQSEWGYVRFQEFCLPFIYKFGLPMLPVKILVTTVFDACKCMIPKSVLNRILATQGTILVSWEEVQRIEKEQIIRSTGVRNGDKLLKVHLFFEGYYDMMAEVKKRHEAAKLKSGKKVCKWLSYIEDNRPMDDRV